MRRAPGTHPARDQAKQANVRRHTGAPCDPGQGSLAHRGGLEHASPQMPPTSGTRAAPKCTSKCPNHKLGGNLDLVSGSARTATQCGNRAHGAKAPSTQWLEQSWPGTDRTTSPTSSWSQPPSTKGKPRATQEPRGQRARTPATGTAGPPGRCKAEHWHRAHNKGDKQGAKGKETTTHLTARQTLSRPPERRFGPRRQQTHQAPQGQTGPQRTARANSQSQVALWNTLEAKRFMAKLGDATEAITEEGDQELDQWGRKSGQLAPATRGEAKVKEQLAKGGGKLYRWAQRTQAEAKAHLDSKRPHKAQATPYPQDSVQPRKSWHGHLERRTAVARPHTLRSSDPTPGNKFEKSSNNTQRRA